MAVGTAQSAVERPSGHIYQGVFTLDIASIAAAGRDVSTVTVTGLAVGDVVAVSPQTQLLAGLVIASVRCSAANTLEVIVANHSAGAVDQASTVFNYGVIRGSTYALR